MSRIRFLDTTLRDGELAPDFKPSAKERADIAGALEAAGIDVIELASTADDDESFALSKRIARDLMRATVCCIAPIGEREFEKAARFLDGISRSRIHFYLDARSIRRLEADADFRDQTLASMEAAIGRARQEFAEVEFSPQDATRTDPRTLVEILSLALDAGATIINISDTTGTATPRTIARLFDRLHESVSAGDAVAWSLHGHNHRGRAAENALAAIDRGVVQIEGTINGVGPAGGNTNLIEVAEMIRAGGDADDRLEHIDFRLLRKVGAQPALREFL
jgi:2-isopropylmalate synthase